MTEKRKPGTHWRCKKCDSTLTTALPAKQVLCPTCKQRLGTREQWMTPND